MARPLYNEHRVLKAEEVLALTIFDEHRGLEPIKVSSCEKRMLPMPLDESFLFESGYLVEGTVTGGRPLKGTGRISVEGRQAIRDHFPGALKDLAKRLKDCEVPRQKEIWEDLQRRLEAVKDKYSDSEELEAETPQVGRPAPVKRRDAKGKLLTRAQRVAAAAAELEEGDAKGKKAEPSKANATAGKGTPPKPAPGGAPRRRR